MTRGGRRPGEAAAVARLGADCYPQLLGRPPVRPLPGHDLVERVIEAVFRRVDLVHRLDDETGIAQLPHPLTMRGMELDAAAWPLHSAGLPLTAKQPISSNSAIGRD